MSEYLRANDYDLMLMSLFYITKTAKENLTVNKN